jgi:hypothetical protein
MQFDLDNETTFRYYAVGLWDDSEIFTDDIDEARAFGQVYVLVKFDEDRED